MLAIIEELKYNVLQDNSPASEDCTGLEAISLVAGMHPAPAASAQEPWVNVQNAVATIGGNCTKIGADYFFQAGGRYGFWHELDVMQANLEAMDAATRALGVSLPPLSD
jgi:hypothetical protein